MVLGRKDREVTLIRESAREASMEFGAPEDYVVTDEANQKYVCDYGQCRYSVSYVGGVTVQEKAQISTQAWNKIITHINTHNTRA